MAARRKPAIKTAAGNGQLEQALAVLLNNQAQFVGQVGRMENRFARLDERLAHIESLLAQHHQILIDLPEAIREKIGFQPRP